MRREDLAVHVKREHVFADSFRVIECEGPPPDIEYTVTPRAQAP